MERQKEFLVARLALCVMCLVVLLVGCTRRVYVPVENTSARADTVERIIRVNTSDTVREREYVSDLRYDSVAPILDSLNRVIGWDRYHFREVTKMNDRERASLLATVDSLRQVRADSVYVEKPYPVEVVKEVERKRRWWETALLWAAGIAVAAVLSMVATKWRKTYK